MLNKMAVSLLSNERIRLFRQEIMLNPVKIPLNNCRKKLIFLRSIALLGLLILLAPAISQAAVYYSTGELLAAVPAQVCTSVTTTGIKVETCQNVVVSGDANSGTAATIYFPLTATTARVRLQLSGVAGPGYRAGMVLAQLSTVLGVGALGDVTLRTFLSTKSATAAQETRVVAASVAQAQLLAARGLPTQLEFVATQSFDQIEIEFTTPLSVGQGLQLKYAYAIGVNPGVPVGGYLSQFGSSQAGQYSTGGSCASAIDHPERAVNADLTDYASFSSLATVACPGWLQTALNGTSPASYRAGFVIGNSGLADADLLGGLTLHTYLGGTEQQHATGSSLLAVSVLPGGQRLVSFPANAPFDAVAIERNGLVTALDNLQLYYGVGVAATSLVPPVLSNFGSGQGHTTVQTTGPSIGSVSSPDNAAGPNLDLPATIQVQAGLLNATTLRVDLNGVGNAGNRAGMVLGQNSLLDVAALDRVTLITYDQSGNVVESASGESLLNLNLLPDGRQQVSFNTTRPFTKVAIRIGGVAQVVDTRDIYYAFADSYNGSISIVNPSPLPVSLISFGVRRASGTGHVVVSWVTASEQHSAYFVVERSANPAAGFTAVGQVAAAGSSIGPRHYALTDAAPAGTLYYRLRQVDQDGQQALSAVAVAAASSRVAFGLYPNPAPAGPGTVTLAGSVGASVCLYTTTGQLLRQQSCAGPEANTLLDTSELPAGLYRVVVRGARGEVAAAQQLEIQ